jgi:hypothetical protein
MTRYLAGLVAAICLAIVPLTPAGAADLDPKAVVFKLPDQIEWKQGGNNPGVRQAVLQGDPSKPGLYVVLTKWLPGNMSRPHFHPNDRFITVISGTWWVGSGETYDPDSTVPMPAGSFVTHFAKGVHYDGAKDGETVILIVGDGPATSTPIQPR